MDEATDDAWEFIAGRDPSPSLAVLGETYNYGRQVALTFDDGPDPNVTPAVLDVLRDHELKATFFVVGRRVARNPETVRRIVREGHSLGNHTYNHPNMADLGAGQMRNEMQSTQEAVDRALGYSYPMTLMRPPYGAPYLSDQHMRPLFQSVMRERRAYPVMWTVDSRDWELEGQAYSIAENVHAGTSKEGGVILLHDTHESTAEALPRIIAQYSAAGFSFATVARDAGRQIRRRAGLNPDEPESRRSGVCGRDTPIEGRFLARRAVRGSVAPDPLGRHPCAGILSTPCC
jgi:peptidoglycan/xylan/chitin deacetylase (PgdA/CDA1 family)